MKKSLYVISDLHLGGKPAENGKPSFQMCSPKGQAQLTSFLTYITGKKSPYNDIHLVLNGDVVDFLAEKEFSSFTRNDELATKKLDQIIKTTSNIWNVLNQFVAAGCQLTILLGNHDSELSLPGPKRLLMETLGVGRVEFIYDNQAFTEGPVLIEHGNRYDGWNVVSHGALRAIRSALSRKESPIEYLGPAGSQLVQTAMNPIKEKFPFVDLLKPENQGMLPILAVLNPSAAKYIPELAILAKQAMEVEFDDNGIPLDTQNIAGKAQGADENDKFVDLALELSGAGRPGDMAGGAILSDLWERLKSAVSEARWNVEVGLMYKALRAFAGSHRNAFNVNFEEKTYLTSAKASLSDDKGFKVIIYGHTHLVKRIKVGDSGKIYLNTGTWADLIKVPKAILEGDEQTARSEVSKFLEDIKDGKLDEWRCQIPTFARVDFDDGTMLNADVYFYENGDAVPVPDGALQRVEH